MSHKPNNRFNLSQRFVMVCASLRFGTNHANSASQVKRMLERLVFLLEKSSPRVKFLGLYSHIKQIQEILKNSKVSQLFYVSVTGRSNNRFKPIALLSRFLLLMARYTLAGAQTAPITRYGLSVC